MPGIDKVLEKVGKTIASGNFYEGQQMYKTIYHRYRSRKQVEDSYQILKGGAVQQLHSKQVTCGVELGLLLLEAYIADNAQASGEKLQSILEIVAAFPSAASEESTELEEYGRFIAAALKWANKCTTDPAQRLEATTALHNKYGTYLAQSCGWQQLGRASVHLARGDDSIAFATALHDACSSSGAQQDEDLFVVRAVLQVLASASGASSSRQLQHAQQLLDAYKQQWGLPDAPLVNFAQLLLQALRKQSTTLFKMLRQTYAAALQQDPSFNSFLDKIGGTYLGIGNAGQQSFGGLFGSLLRSFTELDDEGDNAQ